MEARRALGDEAREKDVLQRSNTELRAAIRSAEQEKARCGVAVGEPSWPRSSPGRGEDPGQSGRVGGILLSWAR